MSPEFQSYFGWYSASRLSRDRALLALRLAEPRQAGFVRGRLRSLARARTSGSRLSRDLTASGDLLPRGSARRGRHPLSAVERDRPLNADVPSPLSSDDPTRVSTPRSRRPKSGPQFGDFVQAEMAKWAKVTEEAGIVPE